MGREREEAVLEMRIARAKSQIRQIETEEKLTQTLKKLWQSRLIDLRARLRDVRGEADIVDLMGKKEE